MYASTHVSHRNIRCIVLFVLEAVNVSESIGTYTCTIRLENVYVSESIGTYTYTIRLENVYRYVSESIGTYTCTLHLEDVNLHVSDCRGVRKKRLVCDVYHVY